jgi:NAD-dependent deacetylase
MAPEPLPLDDRCWLLVLTGAGVSAESGVPTFRGIDGLWRTHPVETVASPDGFDADPALVWEFYSERRARAQDVAPNAGHAALARAEAMLGERFLLVTQNVDGLHRRAGTSRLVELHGNLFTSRCSKCSRAPFADESVYPAGTVPTCDVCGARLRPHIVWFGEMLEERNLAAIEAFLERARGGTLLFLAAGTSGAVYPAAGLVDVARRAGAKTWLVNADAADNAQRFDHVLKGKSGELLPLLLGR